MQRIIGIDFGTSTTYMNVKRYNGSQPLEDRFSFMPVEFNYGGASGCSSVIRENADGTFDFGDKAGEDLAGSHIYKEVKMLLESPDEEQRVQARRITEQFFKFLYETYAQQTANLGSADDTEETIVSYPVKWKDETAQFMLDAAQKAGFQNVRGMDEASAAVFAVLCQNATSKLVCADKPGYLMLVDMGAGTTDMVICRYQADEHGSIKIELVSNWPRTADEPTFGGREIDVVLEKYVEDYMSDAVSDPVFAPMVHTLAAESGQAKSWKEKNVSPSLAANKPVDTCAYIGKYRATMLSKDFPAFDRKKFEQLAESGLHDYVRLLSGCLTDAAEKLPDFASAGLDLVILTGGHSAWYFAREIIDGTMSGYLEHPALETIRSQKARVVNLPNPQTTVSRGLVYSKLPFQLRKTPPAKPAVQVSAEQPATGLFEMLISDTFKTGRGLVVTGTVSSGSVSVNSYVVVRQGQKKVKNTSVLAIEKNGQFISDAKAGDAIGVLLPTDCAGHVTTDMTLCAAQPDVLVLPLTAKEIPYAQLVLMHLKNRRIHAEIDTRKINLQIKISEGMQQGVQYFLSISTRDNEQGKVSVLSNTGGKCGIMTVDTFAEKFLSGEPVMTVDIFEEFFQCGGPSTPMPPVSNRQHRWDDRLLPVIRRFVKEDPALNARNEVHKPVAQLMKGHFNLPASETLYYAHNTAMFATSGKEGEIFSSSGIYIRSTFLGVTLEHVSWGEFLNAKLAVEKSPVVIDAGSCRLNLFGDVWKEALPKLQSLLQECADKLESNPDTVFYSQEESEPEDAQMQSVEMISYDDYDPSKCPKCNAVIPTGEKKCPLCGRARLPELTVPYKLSAMAWFKGETSLGIAKAALGTLTIQADRIEYKKHVGNAAATVIPYYNIYATVKANTDPREIFWLRDIANVKESTYGLGVPSFVITMHNGEAHTFTAGAKTTTSQDLIHGAVALLQRQLAR